MCLEKREAPTLLITLLTGETSQMSKIEENDKFWVIDEGAEYTGFISAKPSRSSRREMQRQKIRKFLRENGIDLELISYGGVNLSHTFKLIKVIKDNPIFDLYTWDRTCLKGQFALIQDTQDKTYHLFGLKDNFIDFRKVAENVLW